MSITITRYGHSCFLVQNKTASILLDPYSKNSVPGYTELDVVPNMVVSSHFHDDHFVENYPISDNCLKQDLPRVDSYDIPHDDKNGILRGMNKVSVMYFDDMKVVHMGDIGTMPGEDIITAAKNADVLMLPVGGYFTIDGKQAAEIAKMIDAKITLPMHYRTEKSGYPLISTLEEFEENRKCIHSNSSELIVDKNTEKATIALKSLKEEK